LQLKEIEGNALEGQTLVINAAGLTNGSLRGQYDGYTYFGYAKTNVFIYYYIE
jgi:hypothetical protein